MTVPLLVCFDTDGTLETSNGPVTVAMLDRLLDEYGIPVVIVSPSAARPPDFEVMCDDPVRRDNLLRARAAYPAAVCLYVSDNNDQDEARAAGFIYVDRMDFAAVWKGALPS